MTDEDLEWESLQPTAPLASWADVRRELENHLPRIENFVDQDELIENSKFWSGIYAIPNCPNTLDVETAISAYKCAVHRLNGKTDKVKHTPALDKKLASFVEEFRSLGGVSLYHWAFTRVFSLRDYKPFTIQRASNTGVGVVFNKELLTPRNLSSMFRQFPSRQVICYRACEEVILYKARVQEVLAKAMTEVLRKNQVQAGITLITEELPLSELKEKAALWYQTAKSVEASLNLRISAGEDIWAGLFPSVEK